MMMEVMISETLKFELITVDDISLIKYYLAKANYKESNHNIVNMFIWLDYYPIFKHEYNDVLYIISLHEGQYFMYMPLCENDRFKEALTYIDYILENINVEMNFSCFIDEYAQILMEHYPSYKSCNTRGAIDYICEVDKFKSFSGKKLQKKRNHLNYFYANYDYSYEKIDSSNIDECIEFLNEWNKGIDNIDLTYEKNGITRILQLYDRIEYKGGLIRIDGKVEGFIICSRLNQEFVQENVEKANEDFRGIYQALLQQFFLNENIEEKFVNREDDMGLDTLKQAKLAYNPCELLQKHWLCPNN